MQTVKVGDRVRCASDARPAWMGDDACTGTVVHTERRAKGALWVEVEWSRVSGAVLTAWTRADALIRVAPGLPILSREPSP